MTIRINLFKQSQLILHKMGDLKPQQQQHHPVVVVAVPFPAQSHLNQLLQLAALISATTDVPVHYACSGTHVRQARQRYNNQQGLAKIHFHEFPTPEFTSPPPDPSVRFPAHLQPLFDSTFQLREPMAALLREISPTAERVVVIHDVLMSYVVQDTADVAPNAKCFIFEPTGAFADYYDAWQFAGKSHPLDEEEPEDLPGLDKCFTQDALKLIAIQIGFLKSASGFIYNTCRSIEGKYIDFIRNGREYEDTPFWAIGPLNLATGVEEENGTISSRSDHKCLDWLDMQPPKSVLYVSFGSITPLKDDQIVELAKGLVESKQKFIWVLRDVDRGDIFKGNIEEAGSSSDSDKSKSISELLEGYDEKLKENGMVVKDWAPQEDILRHPSTGGFMSHCGWNSCLESITYGVPIAAWPMHSDQPKNAFLVTNVLKMGLFVKKWALEDEIVNSSTISEAVERLIASAEGEEMRKRAAELSDVTRKAVKEGGVSRLELDSFIDHITTS